MQDQRHGHRVGAAGLGHLGGATAPEHREQDVDHTLGQTVRHRREIPPLERHEAPLGVHEDVPWFDGRELTVPEGHQRPLGVELVVRDPEDGQHQLLGPLGGPHQRPGDAIECVHGPSQPRFGRTVLVEETSLDRPQAEE